MEVMTVSVRTNARVVRVQMGLLPGLCVGLDLSLVFLGLHRTLGIVDRALQLAEERRHARSGRKLPLVGLGEVNDLEANNGPDRFSRRRAMNAVRASKRSLWAAPRYSL